MTTARAALAALTATVLIAAAAAAAAGPGRGGPGEVKGVWAVEAQTFSGVRVPDPKYGGLGAAMSAFADTEYVKRQGGNILEEGSYQVDASKSPGSIDLLISKGPEAGRRQLGIYEVVGDTLRLCLAAPGATARPRSFDAGPGSMHLLVLSKRFRP